MRNVEKKHSVYRKATKIKSKEQVFDATLTIRRNFFFWVGVLSALSIISVPIIVSSKSNLRDTVNTTATIVAPQVKMPTTVQATPSSTLISTVVPTLVPKLTSTPNSPKAGDSQVNSIDHARMIFVPAGEFQMGLNDAQISTLLNLCEGCSYDKFSHSTPLHDVYLDAYWIYEYEVTNKEYGECVDDGVCIEPVKSYSSTRTNYYGNNTYVDYPVVFVDWQRSYQYCQWAGGSLPSEAQWEKAARGSDDSRIFPWGDEAPSRERVNVNEWVGDTVAVGGYPVGASPYGVMDMAGNVYEWNNDWYSPNYYSDSPYKNPQGPNSPQTSPPRKVVRGGNWYWEPAYATNSFHDWWEPEKSNWDVGFRCVLPYR